MICSSRIVGQEGSKSPPGGFWVQEACNAIKAPDSLTFQQHNSFWQYLINPEEIKTPILNRRDIVIRSNHPDVADKGAVNGGLRMRRNRVIGNVRQSNTPKLEMRDRSQFHDYQPNSVRRGEEGKKCPLRSPRPALNRELFK